MLIKEGTVELNDYEPFLKASLGWTKMKCGNPRCKCARGELHTGCYLSYRLGNKTSTVHIPKAMAKKVEQSCRNWRKLKKMLETQTHQTIRQWLGQYRQGKKIA